MILKKIAFFIALSCFVSTNVAATQCYYLSEVRVRLEQGVKNAGSFSIENDDTRLRDSITPEICENVTTLFENKGREAIAEKWGELKADKHFPNMLCTETMSDKFCSARYVFGNTDAETRCQNGYISGEQFVQATIIEEKGLPPENQFTLKENGELVYRQKCEVITVYEVPGSGDSPICDLN